MRLVTVLVLLTATLLGGCAVGPRVVDAEARAIASLPAGAPTLAGARYRFEPLPSQVGQPAGERVQAMAQAALARAGLVRDDAQPRLAVQATATVNAYWAYDWGTPYGWGRPGWSLGVGVGHHFRGGSVGFGFGVPMGMDPSVPAYLSEVSLLMRDLASGRMVYEARARHDGPWHDTDNVLAALFVAALQYFPSPPPGPFRVGVPLLPKPVPPAPSAPAAPPGGAAPPPVASPSR
ncbi:DUF4136 domain-containing protein [Ottowia sp.]|uniref:DUF4136 domain-containing protein n=1 Tax=Ottowia sp. TaxID=1898956 RepID=UPI0026254889|nr:DUF4136 domain-containing protein [Ottowia sp.]